MSSSGPAGSMVAPAAEAAAPAMESASAASAATETQAPVPTAFSQQMLEQFTSQMSKYSTPASRAEYNAANGDEICAACIKANRDCIVQDDRLRCQGCIEHRIMGVPCSRVTAERRARVMKNMKLSDELFEELLVNYRSEAKGVSRPRIPRTTAPSPESESGRNRYTSSPPPRPSRVRTKPIDSERTGRAIESQRSRPTESETIRNLRREIAAVDAEIDQFDDAFYQAHEDGNVLQERCDDLEAAGTTQTGLAEVTHDIALIQKVNQVFMDFDAKRIGAERAFGEVLQSLESYLRGRKEILGFEEVFGAGFGLVSASGFGSIGLRAISNSGIGLNSGRRRSERGEGDDEHIRKRQRISGSLEA